MKLISLESLNLDPAHFLSGILPTFQHLQEDPYDTRLLQLRFLETVSSGHFMHHDYSISNYYMDGTVPPDGLIAKLIDKLKPSEKKLFDSLTSSRRRAVAKIYAIPIPGGWKIMPLQSESFSQSLMLGGGKYYSVRRNFKQISAETLRDPQMHQLLCAFCNQVADCEDVFKGLTINIHQITIAARNGNCAEGAPEGMHRDGADYIQNIVVERNKHVVGGESLIYNNLQQPHHRVTLEVGEGYFLNDRWFWHDVTPIHLAPNTKNDKEIPREGRRSIIGFDGIIER